MPNVRSGAVISGPGNVKRERLKPKV